MYLFYLCDRLVQLGSEIVLILSFILPRRSCIFVKLILLHGLGRIHLLNVFLNYGRGLLSHVGSALVPLLQVELKKVYYGEVFIQESHPLRMQELSNKEGEWWGPSLCSLYSFGNQPFPTLVHLIPDKDWDEEPITTMDGIQRCQECTMSLSFVP